MSDVADNRPPFKGVEHHAWHTVAEFPETCVVCASDPAPTPNTDRRKCLCCNQWHTFAESGRLAAEQEVERLREQVEAAEKRNDNQRINFEKSMRILGEGRRRAEQRAEELERALAAEQPK